MNLRDPFDHTYEKGGFTYVSWSQVADRLDEAAPGWSFEIRQLGEDWCWGRLTIDGRTFDNIGYAENASADWKKEALKDATSDALKRCAAIAGVARYLYDKEGPQARPAPAPRPTVVPADPQRPVAPPAPVDADPYADIPWDPSEAVPYSGPVPEFKPIGGPPPMVGDECPLHPGMTWKGTTGDLYHKKPEGGYCRPAGQAKKARSA